MLSKKGEHPLLSRLLKVVDMRLPFAEEVSRLKRQHQWLIELAQLLDVLDDKICAQQVKQSVDRYLQDLTAHTVDEADSAVAAHIDKTFRSLWWGLFTCYDVAGLPRTNNGLERFMRLVKTSQRRITGRKQVQDFIVRYGEFVTYLDYEESLPALLERLQCVTQEDFLTERRLLDASILRETKRHRFRHHREKLLRHLEARWAEAIQQDNS